MSTHPCYSATPNCQFLVRRVSLLSAHIHQTPRDSFQSALRLLYTCDQRSLDAGELFPDGSFQALGYFGQFQNRIEAEHELHIVVLPSIKMPRLRKVPVASPPDLLKALATTEIHVGSKNTYARS